MFELFKKRRNVVALLTFFGVSLTHVLRINLSIAIVDMTKENFENSTSQDNHFNWDSVRKGHILSAFFYGYASTQIIGGYLSTKYGGVTIFGLSIGIPSALALLTQLCSNYSFYALILLRVTQGLFMGAAFPSLKTIWSKWSPPAERSKLMSLTISGTGVGAILGFSGCGWISHILGWPYAFYIPGGLGILWYIIWFLFIANDPRDDPHISDIELKLLNMNLHDKRHKVNYPWKNLFKSIPVWALVVASTCDAWGGYTMITQLPTYLKQRYNYSSGSTGSLLTLPYLLRSLVSILSGIIADKIRKKRFTTTQVRKFCTGFSFLNNALFTGIIALFVNSPIMAVLCLTFSIGINGMNIAGNGVNSLDLAPQYAGMITGITNTFGTLSGVICPNVAGYIVTHGTQSEWQIVFLISSAVYCFGAIIYITFASGEQQAWAINCSNEEKDEETNMYCSQDL